MGDRQAATPANILKTVSESGNDEFHIAWSGKMRSDTLKCLSEINKREDWQGQRARRVAWIRTRITGSCPGSNKSSCSDFWYPDYLTLHFTTISRNFEFPSHCSHFSAEARSRRNLKDNRDNINKDQRTNVETRNQKARKCQEGDNLKKKTTSKKKESIFQKWV